MRIAFVGKGGSGKSTLAALFAKYVARENPNVILIDADVNMHQLQMLGVSNFRKENHISFPESSKLVKEHLKGGNHRIKDMKMFRKSTPPATGSNLINFTNPDDYITKNYTFPYGDLRLMVVGTYETEGIGTSCYHGNLSILENVLSHTKDNNEVIVTDMTAGTDAFANTLHANFDFLVIVVEPTLRSVEVYKQYQELAKNSGTSESLYVIGNKIRNQKDKSFLKNEVLPNQLLGWFGDSDYIREIDQNGSGVSINKLEKENLKVLEILNKKVISEKTNAKKRLELLVNLHKKYIEKNCKGETAKEFLDQIDEEFLSRLANPL